MIIFVGEKLNSGFVKEVASNPEINQEVMFIEGQYHIEAVKDEILIACMKGPGNIIYDVNCFLDEARILIREIVSIRNANGAEPILFAPTTHKNNRVIAEALDNGITRFINSTADMTTMKSELLRCLAGYYDNNERGDILEIKEAKEQKELKAGSCKTIGIAGSCHRMGTTTQAIQIVKYLRMKGYRACYVEMNTYRYPNMYLTRREEPEIGYVLKAKLALDCQFEDKELGLITIDGVDMYYKEDRLSEIMDRKYDFYVYDYGTYTEKGFNKASFLKDDINIFSVGANVTELDQTLNILQNVSYDKANLLFSFTAEADRKEIIDLMKEWKAGGRCFFTEYTPNPFVFSNIELFDDMLKLEGRADGETKKDKNKRFNLFKRIK